MFVETVMESGTDCPNENETSLTIYISSLFGRSIPVKAVSDLVSPGNSKMWFTIFATSK